MSIDARVKTVICNEDGSGELRLIDRPARREGDSPGIAGQKALSFDDAPHEVTALNGLDIWGGDNTIMLGHCEIARRKSYTKIVFVGDQHFKEAVAKYHGKTAV